MATLRSAASVARGGVPVPVDGGALAGSPAAPRAPWSAYDAAALAVGGGVPPEAWARALAGAPAPVDASDAALPAALLVDSAPALLSAELWAFDTSAAGAGGVAAARGVLRPPRRGEGGGWLLHGAGGGGVGGGALSGAALDALDAAALAPEAAFSSPAAPPPGASGRPFSVTAPPLGVFFRVEGATWTLSGYPAGGAPETPLGGGGHVVNVSAAPGASAAPWALVPPGTLRAGYVYRVSVALALSARWSYDRGAPAWGGGAPGTGVRAGLQFAVRFPGPYDLRWAGAAGPPPPVPAADAFGFVHAPPHRGTLSVEPSSGFAGVTSFSVASGGWAAGGDDSLLAVGGISAGAAAAALAGGEPLSDAALAALARLLPGAPAPCCASPTASAAAGNWGLLAGALGVDLALSPSAPGGGGEGAPAAALAAAPLPSTRIPLAVALACGGGAPPTLQLRSALSGAGASAPGDAVLVGAGAPGGWAGSLLAPPAPDALAGAAFTGALPLPPGAPAGAAVRVLLTAIARDCHGAAGVAVQELVLAPAAGALPPAPAAALSFAAALVSGATLSALPPATRLGAAAGLSQVLAAAAASADVSVGAGAGGALAAPAAAVLAASASALAGLAGGAAGGLDDAALALGFGAIVGVGSLPPVGGACAGCSAARIAALGAIDASVAAAGGAAVAPPRLLSEATRTSALAAVSAMVDAEVGAAGGGGGGGGGGAETGGATSPAAAAALIGSAAALVAASLPAGGNFSAPTFAFLLAAPPAATARRSTGAPLSYCGSGVAAGGARAGVDGGFTVALARAFNPCNSRPPRLPDFVTSAQPPPTVTFSARAVSALGGAGGPLAAAVAGAGGGEWGGGVLDVSLVQFAVSPFNESAAAPQLLPPLAAADGSSGESNGSSLAALADAAVGGVRRAQGAGAPPSPRPPSAIAATLALAPTLLPPQLSGDALAGRPLDSRVLVVGVTAGGSGASPVLPPPSPGAPPLFTVEVPLRDLWIPVWDAAAVASPGVDIGAHALGSGLAFNVTCPAAPAPPGPWPALRFAPGERRGAPVNATLISASSVTYSAPARYLPAFSWAGRGAPPPVPAPLAAVTGAPADASPAELAALDAAAALADAAATRSGYVYKLAVDCGGGAAGGPRPFLCGPGTEGREVTVRCPAVAPAPQCLTWDAAAARWVAEAACTAVGRTATTVTCACAPPRVVLAVRFAAREVQAPNVFAATVLAVEPAQKPSPAFFTVLALLLAAAGAGAAAVATGEAPARARFAALLARSAEIRATLAVAAAARGHGGGGGGFARLEKGSAQHPPPPPPLRFPIDRAAWPQPKLPRNPLGRATLTVERGARGGARVAPAPSGGARARGALAEALSDFGLSGALEDSGRGGGGGGGPLPLKAPFAALLREAVAASGDGGRRREGGVEAATRSLALDGVLHAGATGDFGGLRSPPLLAARDARALALRWVAARARLRHPCAAAARLAFDPELPAAGHVAVLAAASLAGWAAAGYAYLSRSSAVLAAGYAVGNLAQLAAVSGAVSFAVARALAACARRAGACAPARAPWRYARVRREAAARDAVGATLGRLSTPALETLLLALVADVVAASARGDGGGGALASDAASPRPPSGAASAAGDGDDPGAAQLLHQPGTPLAPAVAAAPPPPPPPLPPLLSPALQAVEAAFRGGALRDPRFSGAGEDGAAAEDTVSSAPPPGASDTPDEGGDDAALADAAAALADVGAAGGAAGGGEYYDPDEEEEEGGVSSARERPPTCVPRLATAGLCALVCALALVVAVFGLLRGPAPAGVLLCAWAAGEALALGVLHPAAAAGAAAWALLLRPRLARMGSVPRALLAAAPGASAEEPGTVDFALPRAAGAGSRGGGGGRRTARQPPLLSASLRAAEAAAAGHAAAAGEAADIVFAAAAPLSLLPLALDAASTPPSAPLAAWLAVRARLASALFLIARLRAGGAPALHALLVAAEPPDGEGSPAGAGAAPPPPPPPSRSPPPPPAPATPPASRGRSDAPPRNLNQWLGQPYAPAPALSQPPLEGRRPPAAFSVHAARGLAPPGHPPELWASRALWLAKGGSRGLVMRPAGGAAGPTPTLIGAGVRVLAAQAGQRGGGTPPPGRTEALL